MENLSNSRGFSMIELMIVVGIIGIISTIAIPNLINSARFAREKPTSASIISAIRNIKAARGEYLPAITGSTFSGWPCFGAADYSSFKLDACRSSQSAAFQALGFADTPMNPWGYYYALNENEGEHFFGGTACFRDGFFTIRETPDGAPYLATELAPFFFLDETNPGECN